MVTAAELAIALRVDDSTIRDRIRRQEIDADLTVRVGDRDYHYFKNDRIDDLQQQYGVTPLSEDTIRDLFLQFVDQGDMSASYKPVLLLGMLRCADRSGRVRTQDLVSFFRNYYLERGRHGLLVEAVTKKMARVAELDDLEIERTMLTMPFEKFERKGFFGRMRDLAVVRIAEPLWRCLSAADRNRLVSAAEGQIKHIIPACDVSLSEHILTTERAGGPVPGRARHAHLGRAGGEPRAVPGEQSAGLPQTMAGR